MNTLGSDRKQKHEEHNMKLELDSKLHLHGAPEKLVAQFYAAFTLPNPEYIAARKAGRYTGHLDPRLYFCQTENRKLTMPRGTANTVWRRAREHGPVEVEDNRLVLPEIDLTIRGSQRPYQQQAAAGATESTMSVVEAGTGSGKTVMACAIIAARKQPALVLVHNKELLHQWCERIEQFLGVEAGLIGDSQFNVRPVTVGIVNTVRNRLDELVDRFGHVVVDECHRVPASMFTETVTAFTARCLLGLSATPFRNDGLDSLIGWFVGEHRVQVDMAVLHQVGAVLRPKIVERETDFQYRYDDDYPQMLKALTEDQARNEIIVADIRQQAKQGQTSLVVSDRVAHLERLAELAGVTGTRILTGRVSKNERQEIVTDLRAGKVPVILATLQLIGEGFDCPGLDSLLITTPVRFSGRLKQVVGRVLRPAEGKIPVVIDYHDSRVGLLSYQAKCRRRVYRELS